MHIVQTLVILTIAASAEEIFKGCQEPLGLEDRQIKDEQITASFAYENDFDNYGAHRARLNKRTWPPGYRGDPNNITRTWIRVDLLKPYIITSIATQGYGDDSTSDWIENYYVFYSDNATNAYKSTSKSVRDVMLFRGNDDRHKVKLNYLPFPVVAQIILILPQNGKNGRNVGLRMELYGCKPGHKFVARVMIRNTEFNLQYIYPHTDMYQILRATVLEKVSKQLDRVSGFLSANLIKFRLLVKRSIFDCLRSGSVFSPQPIKFIQYVTAELEIYCLASRQEVVLAELEKMKKMDRFFEPSYLSVNYPSRKDCLPPLIDIGLSNKKWPENALDLQNRISKSFKFTVQKRCNDVESSSVHGCSSSSFDSRFGRFLYHYPILMDNSGHFTFLKALFLKAPYSIVYMTCFYRLIVNRSIFGESYDYGFITMKKRQLVAKITGKSTVIKGSKYALFNARDSFDTLLRLNAYHGLNFTWKCESNGMVIPVLDNSFDEESFLNIATPFADVKIDTTWLEEGVNATLTLTVKRHKKTAIARKLLIVYGEPVFTLRCHSNCGVRTKPNKPRIFKMSCNGTTCNHIATFTWKLFYKWTPVYKICKGKSITKDNSTILELWNFTCPGVGELNVTSTAIFNELLERSEWSKSMVLTLANTTRFCDVTPTSGRVLRTDFHVQCFGWTDGGLAARYQFLLLSEKRYVLLSEGEVANTYTTLPVGSSIDNYHVSLLVKITYDDGEIHEVSFMVKVEPVQITEVLDILEHGAKGRPSLSDLLKKGDVNTATTIAIGALSVLKDIPEIKVKTTVVHGFQNVTVKQIEEVHKLLYIIALCCLSSEDSASQDNQAAVLRILNSTMQYLSKGDSSLRKALPLLKGGLFGVGSIINLASAGANERNTKARQIVNTGVHLVNQMSKDLAASLDSRQASINVTSPFVDILITRQNAHEMLGSTFEFQGAIVALPMQDFTFFDGYRIKRDDVLDLKVQIWRINPYSWHETSVAINSTLLDIKIELFKGAKIHDISNCSNEWNSSCSVSFNKTEQMPKQDISANTTGSVTNLSQPIELFIPLNPKRQFIGFDNTNDAEDLDAVTSFISLSSNKEQHFVYHEIDLRSPLSTAAITLIPGLNVKFHAFVQFGFQPTLTNYTFNRTIPDFSSCDYSVDTGAYGNCSSDPFSFQFSWEDTGNIGTHYIGLLYYGEPANATLERSHGRPEITKRNNPLVRIKRYLTINYSQENAELSRIKRSDEPCQKGRRGKRSCLEYKDPPSPGKLFVLRRKDQQEVSSVNYTIRLSSGTCMFWNEMLQKWDTSGCMLGSESTPQHLHCKCDHLTAFGGNFLVTPNPIDYDKVWKSFKNIGESGNVGVLSTVCVLLAVYLLGLIVLRHFDKKDKEKVINRTIELQSSDVATPYTYKVQMETGIWKHSGTSAAVAMNIYGENASSGPVCLTDSEHLQPFARASVNTFFIHLDETLGSLIKVRVWHDNGGDDPDWYLHQVVITDIQTKQKWHFFVNKWLAVNRADGSLAFEAKTFNNSDGSRFRNFFTIRTARGFANDHLWISLFTRPPHSPFTRCQRFGCCMSILFTAMIANAMFYRGVSGVEEDNFYIGPLKLNLTAIIIGIQSAIVCIPINVIIVMIFKRGQTKSGDDEGASGESKFQRILVGFGWFLCNAAILASAVYVVFYSMQWGKELSNLWLMSVVISSIQDIFITGPIKVVAIACLLAAILKSPPKVDISNTSKQSVIKGNGRVVEQPKETELERSKLYNERKSKCFKVVRSLVRITVLFLLFVTVCYGNRDRSRYMLTKSVKDIFNNFEKVHHPKAFWEWAKGVLIPGLYNTTWYNNQDFNYTEGFISNHEAFLIGSPRLRQIRIKPIDECIATEIVHYIEHMFKRCLTFFSPQHEDRGPHYGPKWQRINQNLSQIKTFCPKAWRYEESVDSFGSFEAKGSYIAELGYRIPFALSTVEDLEKNRWIDDFTVAVFVEFIIFEPASRLFSVVRYSYSKRLNGKADTRTLVDTLSLYPPSNNSLRGFLFICKIALLVYVIILFIAELRKAFKKKCKYFRKLWSWFDLCLLLLCIGSLVLTSFVEYYASKFVQKIKENPYKNWSTESLVFHSDVEIAFLGFVLFVLTIRMIKVVSFNRPVLVMLLSLKASVAPLCSFGIIFCLAVMAFSMLANVAFGTSVYVYSSVPRAFLEVLQLGSFGGKIEFELLCQLSPLLGPMYMFLLRAIMTFILINFFIAIMNFSYAVSNKEANRSEVFENLILANFAQQQFKKMNLWKTFKEKVTIIISNLSEAAPKCRPYAFPRKQLLDGRRVSACEDVCAKYEYNIGSMSEPPSNLQARPPDDYSDTSSSGTEVEQPRSAEVFVEIPPQSDELEKHKTLSTESIDDFDDIEFLDEDDLMASVRKSLSEISLSLSESIKDLSTYSSTKTPSEPAYLPQSQELVRSPSESLLYSGSSRSNALSRSNRSIDLHSLQDDASVCSFDSNYYRIDEDYSR